MGKKESKLRKLNENKITLSSKIKRDFNCPLCNKKFIGSMTYLQLNQHLFRCGNIHSKPTTSLNMNLKKNLSFTNINSNYISETNRENQKYNGSTSFKSQIIKDNAHFIMKINSDKHNQKKNNIILEKTQIKNDKNNIMKIEEFISHSPPHTLEGTFEERYNKLKEYFELKKKQMNQSITINGPNIKELLYKIKDCNLYLNTFFIIDNDNENKFSLNEIVMKYFDLMIENNKINVINGKSLSISLKNKIDFELLGYILALLFIYQEIKIKYKLPQLLCKLLINEKITLNDVQYENKELYDELIKIKKEDDLSELEIYFVYNGDDLILNGSQIKVNENNIEDYFDKMINYEIQKYKKEIIKIQDSVFQFIPKNYILNFTGEELYQIVNKFV